MMGVNFKKMSLVQKCNSLRNTFSWARTKTTTVHLWRNDIGDYLLTCFTVVANESFDTFASVAVYPINTFPLVEAWLGNTIVDVFERKQVKILPETAKTTILTKLYRFLKHWDTKYGTMHPVTRYLLFSQFFPVYPNLQTHLKSLTLSKQTPPCKHGFGSHSFMSEKRRKRF